MAQPNFSIGPCSCCGKDADIQMVIGLLRRVGLGAFSNELVLAGFLPVVTGPMINTDPIYGFPISERTRDPLYLKLTNTLVWDDPGKTSFTESFLYDPLFQDMTWTWQGPTLPDNTNNDTSWQPGQMVNVPAIDPYSVSNVNGEGPSVQVAYPVPPSDPNGTFVYQTGSAYTPVTTVSSDRLTCTITSATFVDANGVTWYGFTYTSALTLPYTYEQYAQCADQALDGVTLGDSVLAGSKTYTIQNGIKAKLRYFCDWPKGGAPDVTNTLVVMRTRAGYAYYSIPPYGGLDWGTWAFFGDLINSDGSLACQFPCGADFASDNQGRDAVSVFGRYPLAAHGLPFTANPPRYPGPVYPIPNTGIPGAPAVTAAWICSIKTLVRASVDLSLTAVKMLYDPVLDTLTPKPGNLPSESGELIFLPGDVGGLGFLNAIYARDGICTTSQTQFIGPACASGQPIALLDVVFLGRGQSVTVYSQTYDKNGNWLQNKPGTWSLQPAGVGFGIITPGMLVPSTDGLSAVFTAPGAFSGESNALIAVAIPGCTYQAGVLIVLE